jgi:hypothetical protein
MGHTEIGVKMNVYGHLFDGALGQLTKDLDALLQSIRTSRPTPTDPADLADQVSGPTQGLGGRRKGGWGVKRACHTGHQRSLTVTNGHSKTDVTLG